VRSRDPYSVGSDPSEVLRMFLYGNVEQRCQMFEDYVRSNVRMKQARDAKLEPWRATFAGARGRRRRSRFAGSVGRA
jgi:hypothetical protein